ncbi:hypothetical protein F4821DRAFT_180912 [Hypoxylon rubiginosum]|uniref:Uncharacterized protein n=1 Tax=Hypoxylon rubiginosum TaxID=110542 RepID=A0ACC0CTY5_9PEZI|nr:hypothetical protein F4821DRAFT_180912 [Hypoxylon rubiginosum]
MLRDQLDDDSGFDGGSVIPWRPRTIPGIPRIGTITSSATYPTTSVFARNFDCKSLTMEALNFDLEALVLDGGCSNHGCLELNDEKKDLTTTTIARTTSTNSSGNEDGEAPFPFMDLPLEIRLEVYRWIHLMTPIGPTQSKPWYRNPANGAYYVKNVTIDPDTELPGAQDDDDDAPAPKPKASPVLLPCRPHCYVPTAMLRTSKQIYYETRELPFLENEFVFVNWFTSGPWAARSFMRGLQPWQRDTMRYARLELLSRDLSEKYSKEWTELCRFWAPGLRGLRLKILNGGGGYGGGVGGVGGQGQGGEPEGGVFGIGTTVSGGLSWAVVGLPQRDAPPVRVRDEEGKAEKWIEEGLKHLRQLRYLEIELAIADWDDRTKIEWCRDLEDAVNEKRVDTEPYVRVSCVEKEV